MMRPTQLATTASLALLAAALALAGCSSLNGMLAQGPTNIEPLEGDYADARGVRADAATRRQAGRPTKVEGPGVVRLRSDAAGSCRSSMKARTSPAWK